MLLFWIFCDILSLNVKMYLWLKLYTVPFFVSGQTYQQKSARNQIIIAPTVVIIVVAFGSFTNPKPSQYKVAIQYMELLSMHIPFEGHTERITFLLVDSPVYPLVLGHTWLVQHNPHIKWGGVWPILQWALRCNLRGHSTPTYVQSTLPIRTDPISESDSEEVLSHGSQRRSSVCSESGGES